MRARPCLPSIVASHLAALESSPHCPCWDRIVTTGDERNQLCSRWRRSTKGEPSYDLGRMAAPDTRRPIGGLDEKAASLPPAGLPPVLLLLKSPLWQPARGPVHDQSPCEFKRIKAIRRSPPSRMLSTALPACAFAFPSDARRDPQCFRRE
jgi:hypothetical protein